MTMRFHVPAGSQELEFPPAIWLPSTLNIRDCVNMVWSVIWHAQQREGVEAPEPVSIPRKYWQKIFHPEWQVWLMDYCIENKFIIRIESYRVGEKSKEYCWGRPWHASEAVIVESPTLTKLSLRRERAEKANFSKTMEDPLIAQIYGNFQHITIDGERAAEDIKASYDLGLMTPRKYEYAVENIRMVAEKTWFITRQPQGRCYSTLTSLSRILRRYTLIDGLEISELDIKSCFAACLVKHLSTLQNPRLDSELGTWVVFLQTDFYQKLCELSPTPISREDMKHQFQVWLNGDDCSGIDLLMTRHFPCISWEVKIIKDLGRKPFDILERIESELVIDRVGTRLCGLGIKFFTVHDAIFCQTGRESEVQQIIVSEMDAMGLHTRVVVK